MREANLGRENGMSKKFVFFFPHYYSYPRRKINPVLWNFLRKAVRVASQHHENLIRSTKSVKRHGENQIKLSIRLFLLTHAIVIIQT